MKKRLIAILAAVVAVIPMAANNASAAGAGVLVFECTAKLPAFPSGAGSGTCGNGTIQAATSGGAAVLIGSTAAVITGVGTFDATFSYAEGCVANEPPAIGTAQGQAQVTGLTAVTSGGVTASASGTITFQWTRVGLTAAVVITGGSLTVSGVGSASISAGAATAAFAPILQPNNTCPQGGPLEAVVAGAATLAGT